jgi:hypothetical protein
MASVNINLWQAALQSDRRLDHTARKVAYTLAAVFKINDGRAQMSYENITDKAEILDLAATRKALAVLRRCGWIVSSHTNNSHRRGLV